MNLFSSWFPRSYLGAALAAVYVGISVSMILSDRRSSGGGDWISLKGMGAFLATFPVSALGEIMGMKLDYRRNLDMGFAVGLCALLVYLVGAGVGAGVGRLARMIFSSGGPG